IGEEDTAVAPFLFAEVRLIGNPELDVQMDIAELTLGREVLARPVQARPFSWIFVQDALRRGDPARLVPLIEAGLAAWFAGEQNDGVCRRLEPLGRGFFQHLFHLEHAAVAALGDSQGRLSDLAFPVMTAGWTPHQNTLPVEASLQPELQRRGPW